MSKPLTRIVTVFKTERIEVIRTSTKIGKEWAREFELWLDGNLHGFYDSQSEAEHEAAVWLAEQAQRLAVFEVAA
jgi:uncharacterized protein YbjQ (UPF0145 family)